MVVNNNSENNSHVQFVSYTGKYPNLCRGILTVIIDGQHVSFGHLHENYNYDDNKYDDDNYDIFWDTGGSCGFSNNYSDSHINHGDWIIDAQDIPEQYRQYVYELDAVFNANVPKGCCGGCL